MAGPLSTIERTFIENALAAGVREDGRSPYASRTPSFSFNHDDSGCTLRLGHTLVSSSVSATLRPPYGERPNEGSLRFTVRFTRLSRPDLDPAARPSPETVELGRVVDRGLRDTRAVDVEALVVLPGRKVWHLEVELAVLQDDGGLVDACGLAALGALCAFRRPAVRVEDAAAGRVALVPAGDEETPPLAMHHLPVPVSFALFPGGHLAVDPGAREETAAAGTLAITLTPQGEVCGAQKAHGSGCSPSQLLRCARLAQGVAAERVRDMRAALQAHEAARVAARVRRHGSQVTGILAVPSHVSVPAPAAAPAAAALDVPGEAGPGKASDEAEQGGPDPAPVVRPPSPNGVAERQPDAMDIDVAWPRGDATRGEAAPEAASSAQQAAAAGEEKPSEGSTAPAATVDAFAAPEAKSKKKKKKKARMSEPEEGVEAGDPYAAIAELIAKAGQAVAAPARPADLRSAVRVQNARKKA